MPDDDETATARPGARNEGAYVRARDDRQIVDQLQTCLSRRAIFLLGTAGDDP